MKLFFLDAGTTWSKILEVETESKEKKYSVIKTSEIKNLNINFTLSTGHNSNKQKGSYENEAVALSYGSKYLNNALVLDLGSRDAKWIKFESGSFKDMDWNTSCASATGATIEMLLKFYEIKSSKLIPTKEKYPVTCGIFGLEKIMDDISKGLAPEIAISKFITGIAFNAYNFTKRPDEIYLSGGFCENKCFIKSLNFFTKVIPLGRFLLVDGLYNIYKEKTTCRVL